jgi:hypothetical protein
MNWLLKFTYTERYGGKMVIFTVLPIKNKFALTEISLSLDESSGWPWVRLDFGLNQVFSLIVSVFKFTFEFNLLTRIYDYD